MEHLLGETRGSLRRGRALGRWVALCLLLICCAPAPAHAVSPICILFNYCLYEGVPFTLIVVDRATGQPLADVHALAEWAQRGPWGTRSPLMAQGAVSGPDGVLRFPAWGPLRGSAGGLMPADDPVITLFKPDYLQTPAPGIMEQGMLINRQRAADDRDRDRRFSEDGQTVVMEPYQGTMAEWLRICLGLAWGLVEHSSATGPLREPYLNRAKRVLADVQHFPSTDRDVQGVLAQLQETVTRLEGQRP